MITSERFENAIRKLYHAFHNDTLHPECTMQCAVGNICDNRDSWKHFSDTHGSLQLNYVGRVHEAFGRRFSGYIPSELLQIEAAFLNGCGYELPLRPNSFRPKNVLDKDILFDGLSAALDVLCKFDQIDDVMDISALFNYNPTQSKAHVI